MAGELEEEKKPEKNKQKRTANFKLKGLQPLFFS
jgi:hypothetical protein